MLDLKKILAEPEKYEQLLKARDPKIDLGNVINLYNKKCDLQTEHDSKRNEQRKKSKLFAGLDKKTEEFEQKKLEMKVISEEVSRLREELSSTDAEFHYALLSLPNILHPNVPISRNKEDKIIVRICMEKKSFGFPIKPHNELAESLGIIDFKRSAKIAGYGFPLYVGKGAQLEWALINFMVDHNIKNGFTFILPPLLNSTESLTASGNLPKFKDEIYSCKMDELHLIPTSEVPLTNLYRDEVLDEKNLPMRLTAYSPNFRREAGGHGKAEKGLMRMHQFNKIETYSITKPETSDSELEMLIRNGESMLKEIGLHYRLANLTSCELAHQSAITYDIEIWLPYQDKYSEVSSASNCLDYQARRANIKYKDAEGNQHFVHTLNCSALATPRVMVALIEANQTKDGRILVPSALRKYTGFCKI